MENKESTATTHWVSNSRERIRCVQKKFHKLSDTRPTLPPYFERDTAIFQEAGKLTTLQATLLGSLPPVFKVETPSRPFLTNGVGGRESMECDFSRLICSSFGLRQNGRRGQWRRGQRDESSHHQASSLNVPMKHVSNNTNSPILVPPFHPTSNETLLFSKRLANLKLSKQLRSGACHLSSSATPRAAPPSTPTTLALTNGASSPVSA